MEWKRFGVLFTCAAVLQTFLAFAEARNEEEVIFYEKPDYEGSRIFLKMGSGNCYTMEKDWDNRISSVDTKNHCIIGWEYFGCKGISVKLKPDSDASKDLGRLDFDKQISSISICPSERRTKQRHPSSRDLDIWTVGLEEHNKYRRLHGVEDLEGDVDLHQEAQGHADYLVRHNKFEASPQNQHGENLATSYEKDKLDAIRDVVKRWYDKIEFYNFRDPESNKRIPKSGQFSSVVWKSTTHLGVGVAWNKDDKKWIIVCMYSPPATTSRYEENVFPAAKGLYAEEPTLIRTALNNLHNHRRHDSYYTY